MSLQRTSLDSFHATKSTERRGAGAHLPVICARGGTESDRNEEVLRRPPKLFLGLVFSRTREHRRSRRERSGCLTNDRRRVHTGDYADVRATGRQVQTSVSQQRPSMPGAITVTAIHGAGSDRPRPPRPRRSPPHRRGRNVVVAHIVIGVDRSDNRGCKLAQRVIDQLEELA